MKSIREYGQVVSGLYHQSPLCSRPTGLPPTLAIEEVDCQGAVSAAELSLIARWVGASQCRWTSKKFTLTSRHCPKLRSLVLVYGHGRRDEDHDLGHGHAGGRREDEAQPGRDHQGSHLAPLASLQGLQSLQVGICSLFCVIIKLPFQVLSAEFYSHSLFTVVTQVE